MCLSLALFLSPLPLLQSASRPELMGVVDHETGNTLFYCGVPTDNQPASGNPHHSGSDNSNTSPGQKSPKPLPIAPSDTPVTVSVHMIKHVVITS
jgi:hypothetical protein